MSNKSKTIGICGVRINEQNIMPFFNILKKECAAKGMNLITFSCSTDTQEHKDEIAGQYELINLIQYVDVCALIILSETIKNTGIIHRLCEIGRDKNIPVFSLDRKVDSCYNLLMDNSNCFQQIMNHIIQDHGIKRINMISGFKGERFSDERTEIYKQTLIDNGIPVEEDRIGYGGFWQCPVTDVMEHFFKSDLPFPEAIVCANDIMAHAVISILNEHNYEVPEDVLVTGYDGTKTGEYFFPSITTGSPDYEQMIQLLFAELSNFLETGVIAPYDIVVPVVMKKRQSCGCEPKIISKKDRRVNRLIDEMSTEKRHMEAVHMILSEAFGKQRFEDVFDIIQQYRNHMDTWFDFYRCVFLKTELVYTYNVAEHYTELTNISEYDRYHFIEDRSDYTVVKFKTYVNELFNKEGINYVIIHPLLIGKTVYGIVVDGFEDLIDWKIKHSDEFAMFLSQIIHTVTHEFKMNALNENLSRINQEIEKMSLCDSMTGIYNRRGFFHKMNTIIHNKKNAGKYLYLFMVDMDGLKYINDNFGHAEGDFAIVTLASVLNRIRTNNFVCSRVGGDEFICSYVEDTEQFYTAEGFSQQLEAFIRDVEYVNCKPYPITASVGMVKEQISGDLDLDSMINHADSNMYTHKLAKKAGKTSD